MKGKLTIISYDGDTIEQEVTEPIKLDMLHRAVGGYIETVPRFTTYHGEPCAAFCNEEGKLDNLPINHLATGLWIEALNGLNPHDVLVGNIVIITGDMELLGNL